MDVWVTSERVSTCSCGRGRGKGSGSSNGRWGGGAHGYWSHKDLLFSAQTDGQTRAENITFPQTTYEDGNNRKRQHVSSFWNDISGKPSKKQLLRIKTLQEQTTVECHQYSRQVCV